MPTVDSGKFQQAVGKNSAAYSTNSPPYYRSFNTFSNVDIDDHEVIVCLSVRTRARHKLSRDGGRKAVEYKRSYRESDGALLLRDCFAALAMTGVVRTARLDPGWSLSPRRRGAGVTVEGVVLAWEGVDTGVPV